VYTKLIRFDDRPLFMQSGANLPCAPPVEATIKIRIYIITHRPLFDEFYHVDSSFDSSIFTEVNLSNQKYVKSECMSSQVPLSILLRFRPLGKRWAEFEAMYNLYINGLFIDNDYTGFMHYDYQLHDLFCRSLKELIGNSSRFISFSSFNFLDEYKQRIAMDYARPNVQCAGGHSCYKYILKHYNMFFGTNYNILDIWDKRMCLCNAFCLPKVELEQLMSFLSWVYEQKFLDCFDSNNSYRAQGGFMERYVAVYSALRKIDELEVNHYYNYHKKLAS